MIRTQISMTDAQQDALRRLAALRQISQAAVFRDALDSIIDREQRTHRVRRARNAIGAFRSQTTTASVDHDAVLDDAFSA